MSAAPLASTTPPSPTPARPHPVLVELFTSEGCSSCPPADDLLARLQTMELEAGQTIVVLSEHVTYWNHGGWADRFSSTTFDDRQNIYSGRFLDDDVYTPEAVVNGNEEMVGSDSEAILAAVREQPTTPIAMVRIVRVEPLPAAVLRPAAQRLAAPAAAAVGRRVSLTFAIDTPIPAGTEVYAAISDDMDTTAVQRGENAGLLMKHVAVARSITRVAKLKYDQALTMTVALPTQSDGRTPQHLVLFAQEAGQGRVLSLATAALPMAAAAR